jgi:hypothetical protein
MAREVEGSGVFGIAHERVCYQMWREDSAKAKCGNGFGITKATRICAECIARDLQREAELIQAAMDVLATRPIFSVGPCGCGRGGLSYGRSAGRKS